MSTSIITVRVTAEQVKRWRQVTPGDIADFLTRAGDFYYTRLQIRRDKAERLRAEGRL